MNTTARGRLAQLSDVQLERAIDLSYRALISQRDRIGRVGAWRVMLALIRRRSPEAIARLERDRGLQASQ